MNFHKLVLILILACLWIYIFYSWIQFEYISLLYLLIGITVYYFLSLCVARFSLKLVRGVNFIQIMRTLIGIFLKDDQIDTTKYKKSFSQRGLIALSLMLCPSLLWSEIIKNRNITGILIIRSNTRKDLRKRFIQIKNFLNLLIAVILFIFFLIWGQPNTTSNIFNKSFIALILYRTLSRSLEIILAFGNDAFSLKKSSSLKSPERLLLAITSLFECILNYAVTYFLIDNLHICLWQSVVHSLQCSMLFSFSLLNESLVNIHPRLVDMLQIIQALTSLTLIFLSFAIYISNSDKNRHKGIFKAKLHKPTYKRICNTYKITFRVK